MVVCVCVSFLCFCGLLFLEVGCPFASNVSFLLVVWLFSRYISILFLFALSYFFEMIIWILNIFTHLSLFLDKTMFFEFFFSPPQCYIFVVLVLCYQLKKKKSLRCLGFFFYLTLTLNIFFYTFMDIFLPLEAFGSAFV